MFIPVSFRFLSFKKRFSTELAERIHPVSHVNTVHFHSSHVVFLLASISLPLTFSLCLWTSKFCLVINSDKPPGIDNLDGNLLSMVADSIATPICHIFNLSPEESLCPQAWREAKVIPLPKNGKAAFTGSNSRPISLLPALSKLLGK